MSNFFRVRPERETGEIITSLSALKRLVKKMRKLEEFAFDTETNTLQVIADNENFLIVGISISWGKWNNYYIPLGHRREEDFENQLEVDTVVSYLKPIFEREDIRIIGANIKFDMHVMKRIGISIKTKDLFDVVIASWICDENTPNGLKENTVAKLHFPQTHFGEVLETVPKEVKKQFGLKSNSKPTADLVLIEDLAPYALDDAYYTWELYLGFMSLLEEEKMDKVYYKSYVPFIHTLFNMEEQGVTVDFDKLKQMQKDIAVDIDQLNYELTELAGVEINFGSTKQLSALLFGYNPMPQESEKNYDSKYEKWEEINDKIVSHSFKFKVVEKTATGNPATGSSVLWKLSKMTYATKRKQEGIQFVKKLMEVKKLSKLKSAFIDGLLEQLYNDKKAHPSFNIIGTDSGRISCSSPNLD